MNEKEYPMPDDYNEKSAQLVEFIETRDKVQAAFKDMTPEQRRAAQEPLKTLNESIEALEKHLAVLYEAYQKERRAEEKKNKSGNELMRKMQIMYIFVKQRMPEKLDKFTKNLDNLSPEQREEFFDGVAILETQNLDELLAEEKS